MGENLAFHIPTYSEGNSAFPKPLNDDYDYWVPIINHYLEKTNMVEVHCWNDETDTIEEIKSLPNFYGCKEVNLTILQGYVTSLLTDYLTNEIVDIDGRFKWFTINLYNDKSSVFHSGHWGTEFFIQKVSEKDDEFIRRVTPLGTVHHR
ncbi:hypothetical protein [Cytobacillus oceanisediminis]|uniref:Uncharacterized protein n=1 Tax=Cytobacillus oceanisediminis 2691 TaxID=1196031 RepID=A0A161IYM6_9BACI|nr:hypothetical protein [Cytobacillus oceanisediminis]AND41455.1 hypothetical protein A361_20580 [Cytobacillus oceanisediminis 2691]